MPTNLRAPRLTDPFDSSIERHLIIRTGDIAIPFIWLGFYGIVILNVPMFKFGDTVTEVIELAGLY